MKSFIVEFWSQVFKILGYISPFHIVRCLIPATKRGWGFVDKWVLGHLLLSIVLLFICKAANLHRCEALAVLYGGLRVFELVIYQVNVVLFAQYRARKKGERFAFRGFRRIVILVLHNYAETVFWFALFYRNADWAFKTGGVALDSFLGSVEYSFVTMTTFGYTAISPRETLGHVLTLIQSAIGMFMTLLVLGTFISFLPTPETLDEFEK